MIPQKTSTQTHDHDLLCNINYIIINNYVYEIIN